MDMEPSEFLLLVFNIMRSLYCSCRIATEHLLLSDDLETPSVVTKCTSTLDVFPCKAKFIYGGVILFPWNFISRIFSSSIYLVQSNNRCLIQSRIINLIGIKLYLMEILVLSRLLSPNVIQ